MREPAHAKALRAVLPDLPAGHRAALRHLLTCSACRRQAASSLQEKTKPEYGTLWRDLGEVLPALMREASERRGEIERLLKDLLSPSPEYWTKALSEDTRFHSVLVLEALLDKAREAQPSSPARSDALAGLAADLAAHLYKGDFEEEQESALLQAKVFNLSGNARRLLGNWNGAETALGGAAYSLAFTAEQSWEGSTLCRYLGLLRWEQGRLDEAEALLRQAARSFGEMEAPHEEAASRVLLGLLSLERDRAGKAVLLLQAGRAELSLDTSWLTVRAGLGLALGLACVGHAGRAYEILQETSRHYPAITDEREVVRLPWLEGRVAARLGNGEAESLLEMARRHLMAEHSLADVTLCSLDLASLLMEDGRMSEVPRLLQEIEESFQGETEVLGLIRHIAGDVTSATGKTPRPSVAEAAFTLRRIFRFRGYRVEALPFV